MFVNAIGLIPPAVIALAGIAVYVPWSRRIRRTTRAIETCTAAYDRLTERIGGSR